MQRDDYRMSERGRVKTNAAEAELEGKAGNIHERITHRPQLLGE